MEIVYGELKILGDFELTNIRELGFDRDFMLKLRHRVVNLTCGDVAMQFVDVGRILIRAGLTTSSATVHILQDTDLESALANFSFSADKSYLQFTAGDYKTDFAVIRKANEI